MPSGSCGAYQERPGVPESCTHARRRQERGAQRLLCAQRLRQLQNRAATEAAVVRPHAGVAHALIERRRRGVHVPSGRRHLKSRHRRQRLGDTRLRLPQVAGGQGHAGLGVPGPRLPGALRCRQGDLEKLLGLRLRLRQIALREPQIGEG